MATLAELVGPGFTWQPNRDELDPQIRRDPEQILGRIRDFVSQFEDFETEVEQIREIDESSVVVAVRHRGSLPGTGDAVERREAHLWGFSGERPLSLREFPDLERAIRAAPGGEDTDSA